MALGIPSQSAVMAAVRDDELAPTLVPAITARSSSAAWPWDPLLNKLMAALKDDELAPISVPAITARSSNASCPWGPLLNMLLWQH